MQSITNALGSLKIHSLMTIFMKGRKNGLKKKTKNNKIGFKCISSNFKRLKGKKYEFLFFMGDLKQ